MRTVLIAVLLVEMFALPVSARAGEPSVNFTFRKKEVLPKKPVRSSEKPPPEPLQAAPPATAPEVSTATGDTGEMPSAARAVPQTLPSSSEESRTVRAREEGAPQGQALWPNQSTTVEPAPAAPVPAPVTELVPPPETVWLDDDLPKGSSTEGTWVWETALAASGSKSHGHPAGEGIQMHAVTFAEPLPIRTGQMITQQVWLDPQNPPRGIAIQFQRDTDEEMGVYWEGEEEVFNPAEHEDMGYYGLLPEWGRWTTLEILGEDLGLREARIRRVRFVTFGGRVLWDKTSIKEAPPLEELREAPKNPSVNSN